MSYANELSRIAVEADRQELAIQRLDLCFNWYLEFTRDGREPTKYADGTIAMDAAKASRQLEEAICNLLGYPADVLTKYEDEAA
jgi:hypothetical protein